MPSIPIPVPWTLVFVGTHPATVFVNHLLHNRPTFLRVCIGAGPVTLLVRSLLNGPQGRLHLPVS